MILRHASLLVPILQLLLLNGKIYLLIKKGIMDGQTHRKRHQVRKLTQANTVSSSYNVPNENIQHVIKVR